MSSKNILITGATGMIGGLILDLCIKSDEVSNITSLVRQPTELRHEKLSEIVIDDFLNLDHNAPCFEGIDTVFYCLGVYTGAVDRELFRTITVDYPQKLAETLIVKNPDLSFCLLSGAGADRTETSRLMFAKDKGIVENRLSAMNLKSFHTFRPGYIYPVTPRNEPNFSYKAMRFLYPLLKILGTGFSVTSEKLADTIFKVGIRGSNEEIFENRDILNF